MKCQQKYTNVHVNIKEISKIKQQNSKSKKVVFSVIQLSKFQHLKNTKKTVLQIPNNELNYERRE